MHRGTNPPQTNTPERTMNNTNTDGYDTELSLDELKTITGGVKPAAQTTQGSKNLKTEVGPTDDVFVGFGDLYGI